MSQGWMMYSHQVVFFHLQKAWLKLRNLMVRCFAAALQLGQQCSSGRQDEHTNNAMHNVNGDQKNLAEVLENLVAQLRTHLEELGPKYSAPVTVSDQE